MESEQFRKLVEEVGCGTVLRCPVQSTARHKVQNAPPVADFRYVFPWMGVVYVTLLRGSLSFRSAVRVVDCLAVAYEGKSLGGGTSSL